MLRYLNARTVAGHLPEHKEDIHKYQRGKVTIWAGSAEYTGAALLCAKAAYLSGAGYVKVFSEAVARIPLITGLPEAVFCESGSTDFVERISGDNSRAILVGPGLIANERNYERLASLLKTSRIPVVLDAGALEMLALHGIDVLTEYDGCAVLTPHTGEMAKLAGCTVAEIAADKEKAALEFARKHKCIVLLKGASSVVADNDGYGLRNPFVNHKLATAGSGDVLAGAIAALLAQGLDPFWAAACGCYAHGLSADMASKGGKRNILATNICETLPKAFENVEKC